LEKLKKGKKYLEKIRKKVKKENKVSCHSKSNKP